MEQVNSLWKDVLKFLSEKLSRPSFDTWLKGTKARKEGEKWLVIAPNDFARDWLETRYLLSIKEAIYMITKELPEVAIIIDDDNTLEFDRTEIKSNSKVEYLLAQIELLYPGEKEELFLKLKSKLSTVTKATNQISLFNVNQQLTFDNFIIGSGNRFATAGAKAVAEAPGKAYNPLFIYGTTGLGKTHLLHAIGNYILHEINQDAKVLYTTAEQFINEFIMSIRDNKTAAFRNKYRQVDVLLFDDIQYFSGKEQTQEEFFHIFNYLYEQSKQIVITSNYHPKEIPAIFDRLRSRLEWGLITDILPPDQELKRKVIELICLKEQIKHAKEVEDFLTEYEVMNVSELIAAVKRVKAYQNVTKDILGIDHIKEFFKINYDWEEYDDEEDKLAEGFDKNPPYNNHDKNIEKLIDSDRIDNLEKEIKQINCQLTKLSVQVQSLVNIEKGYNES